MAQRGKAATPPTSPAISTRACWILLLSPIPSISRNTISSPSPPATAGAPSCQKIIEILPSESSQPESELKTELTPRAYSLTRLADVKPERPLWLRLGHIPKGKIVLIDGDPATGKSTLALDIAAHVTTGTVWPDGRRVSLPTQQTCTTNSSTPRN